MPLSIRLPDELEQRLQALAEQTGRTKTFYVTQAVAEHLEELEDLYLAEKEVLALREGRSKSRPWADVRAELFVEEESKKAPKSGRTSLADLRARGLVPKAKTTTPIVPTPRGSARPKRLPQR